VIIKSLIIISKEIHVYSCKGDISGELAGKIRCIPFSFSSSLSLFPFLVLNVLNVNLIFTHYTTDSFVAAVTYSSYSLLRLHVSRGLSVSKCCIFRRRGTAVTGDSISFTNGPVTRGNFCNILNRTLRWRSASSSSSSFSALSTSFSSPLSIPSPLSRTGVGLHCLWTFSRRLRDNYSQYTSPPSREALRVTNYARADARDIRHRINVMRDFVPRKLARYAHQF